MGLRLGPTVEALSSELGEHMDFYRVEVDAEKPEHWAEVRSLFKIGPRLPLLALYAQGRWQRSLQGPNPEEVIRPFIMGPLSLTVDGLVV